MRLQRVSQTAILLKSSVNIAIVGGSSIFKKKQLLISCKIKGFFSSYMSSVKNEAVQ